MSDLATISEQAGAIQLLLDLEANGGCDEVSLVLSDPEMSYSTWEALGRFLGNLDRRSRWYIGDWLNFGFALYGEEASQAIDESALGRYDMAERATGLDRQTLMNISSVCSKIARTRRRPELGFWIHAEVARLDPETQVEWLDKTITEGWTKAQLREQVKENLFGSSGTAAAAGEGDPPPLSKSDRLEHAARLVFTQAQPTSEGYLVPSEAWSQLVEALGEER